MNCLPLADTIHANEASGDGWLWREDDCLDTRCYGLNSDYGGREDRLNWESHTIGYDLTTRHDHRHLVDRWRALNALSYSEGGGREGIRGEAA